VIYFAVKIHDEVAQLERYVLEDFNFRFDDVDAIVVLFIVELDVALDVVECANGELRRELFDSLSEFRFVFGGDDDAPVIFG